MNRLAGVAALLVTLWGVASVATLVVGALLPLLRVPALVLLPVWAVRRFR